MNAVTKFFLEPASARPLAFLRIGLAATLLLQAIFLSSSIYELYGSVGIMQGDLSEYRPDSPFSLHRWLSFLSARGFSEDHVLLVLVGVYVASLLALLVGWKTRVAVTLTWLTHLLLTHSQLTVYGLDQFAHIALFLMLWMPLGATLSVDCRARGRCDVPSWEARLSLRTLQIWLCIAYLASGLVKAIGLQWWTGEAIWRALMLPTYRYFDFSWLADHPWIPWLLGLGTLVVEVGYPVFIWPRRTRKLWIALTLGLHAGIGLFLGLHLFALIMCVLTLTIFGVSAEPVAETQTAAIPWGKNSAATFIHVCADRARDRLDHLASIRGKVR